MGRKSSVELLGARGRELVDRLIREQVATIDEIYDKLEELLGEDAPSRSAVGRYRKKAFQKMERFAQAQAIAKVWVGKLEEDPEGDIGRLLAEMLRTVAFSQLADADDNTSPMDLHFIARAIKDVATADRLHADRVLKIREEERKRAARQVEAEAKRQGASAATVESLRAAIMTELSR